MDVNTDVMVLELLQDVPPEWNQYTAAWTAARPSLNTTFAGIGHPRGDSQTFFAGRHVRCGEVWRGLERDGAAQNLARTGARSLRMSARALRGSPPSMWARHSAAQAASPQRWPTSLARPTLTVPPTRAVSQRGWRVQRDPDDHDPARARHRL